jgi:hypothetical protein
LLCFFLLTVHGGNLSNFILLHQIFRLYKGQKKKKEGPLCFISESTVASGKSVVGFAD